MRCASVRQASSDAKRHQASRWRSPSRLAWGGTWLDERDLVALRDAFEALGRQAASVQQQLQPPRLDDLSRSVLDALAAGRTPAEAASDLGMAESAVSGVVASALARLHRHSRTEAMAYAVDEQVFEQG